jgi:hypothetical protein
MFTLKRYRKTSAGLLSGSPPFAAALTFLYKKGAVRSKVKKVKI